MGASQDQLAAAIATLESQRAILGNEVVETALAPLRRELSELREREQKATQRLKQVSVIFVDVVGSTSIGQKLDPEEIHALMDGALERFTVVVQAHHGRVLQYAGDGMLAAFGSEESAEDDVERAIHAGLAIVEEARLLAPEIRARFAVPEFSVRAGIHTGTVLLGGGVDADGTIRGATVNIAARMEQSAPPGRLRISHDSYRHVRGLFEVIEQEPIRVKGVDTPLRSYLVERSQPKAFHVPTRGVEGVHTRMVGRDRELALLCAEFAATVAEGRARSLTVVGEAGLGKSRLLAEFQQTLNVQTCWLLLARAHPRSESHAYGLLREMLSRQFSIGEGDSTEVSRQKLVDGLLPIFSDEGEAPIHLLGHLIGLDFSSSEHVVPVLSDESRLKELALSAGELCLRRLSASKPVIVVLDDIHWADEGSLEFIRHLLSANRDTPLFALMLSRETLFERYPALLSGNDPVQHKRLDLHVLDKGNSRELAEALLQRFAEVPDALRALLIGAAEGNPFYMEELVKMLIDDGVIVTNDDGWRVLPDQLVSARVPTTLAGVLQARLDALTPRERRALQHAAVVGHVFWDHALSAIEPADAEVLPVLLRKQLVVRRDTAEFDDASEYAFQHNLLHQATYDSLLKAAKRTAHEKAGMFWTTRAEVASSQEVTPVACRALAEAQYHCCKSDARAYVRWFQDQFSNYLGAYAGRPLRPLAERLVDTCEREFGEQSPETANALTNLARVLVLVGSAEQAEPLLQRAIAIEEASLPTDHPDAARTLAVLGGYYQARGNLVDAEPYFRRALNIRERVLGPEHGLTMGTLDNLAKVVLELNRLDEAETLSRRVLAVNEGCFGQTHPKTAFAMTAVGEVLNKRGRFAEAEQLIRMALAAQRQNMPATHPDVGLSMWHLAESLRCLGRLDEAELLARGALEMWEIEFGAEHEWTAWGLIGMAEVRLAQGTHHESASLAIRAATILRRLGADHAAVGATCLLIGRASLAAGDLQTAERALLDSLAALSAQTPVDDRAVCEARALLSQMSAPATTR